jgi:hypothetical protein
LERRIPFVIFSNCNGHEMKLQETQLKLCTLSVRLVYHQAAAILVSRFASTVQSSMQISASSSSRRRQGARARSWGRFTNLTSRVPPNTAHPRRTFTRHLLLPLAPSRSDSFFNSRERSLLLPLHTNTSRPEQQPVLATNATYLHAPAAVPGRVVPGSPPAAAPPCRPTRSAPGTTGASASPGASPGSRRCSRRGSATALQSHRGQQWHHSASQQHDRSSRARQRHSSEHGYWHDGREQACSRLDRTAHEADDTRISPPGAEQEAGTSARAGLDTLAFFRCVKRHLGYVEIANVGRRHGFAPPRDHLRIPAA